MNKRAIQDMAIALGMDLKAAASLVGKTIDSFRQKEELRKLHDE